jgi:hypothetical protein
MKALHNALMLIVVLTTILAGCSKQSNINTSVLEKEFLTAIPITNMNENIQIVIDSKEPSIKPDSTIGLTIYNKSPHSISFDNTSFVTLMGSVDNQHWFPVENGITYTDRMLLSPEGTVLLDLYYTWVKPILPASPGTDTKEVLLRIVIVGKVMDGDIVTGQSVGAYTDVHLKP